MQRKETFAVSGPHIKVRFFGGWNYAKDATVEQKREFWKFVPDWLKDREWVKTAYEQGVPMGGDMQPMPAGATAPSFAVWAVKDPTSGNLDRIQIVKGWTKSGQSFEKVFDVAWAGDREPDKWTGVVPPIGSTVDIDKGTYDEHDRRGRTEDGVDRSRIRSEPARFLLRPRARDSDAALDDDPGRQARHRAAGRRARRPSRSGRGVRRSGTRRRLRRGRRPRPGRRSTTSRSRARSR